MYKETFANNKSYMAKVKVVNFIYYSYSFRLLLAHYIMI